MDLVLHLADDYLLDNVWARLLPLNDFSASSPYVASSNFTSISYTAQSAWPRDYIPRQIISLSVITLLGIHCLYFLFAWLSYKFIFNHEMKLHPRFLENQVKQEIQCSLRAFPMMTLLTLPWFQAEVMGYSKLYDNVEDYGWTYLVLTVPLSVLSPSQSQILLTSLSSSASCFSPTTVFIGCTGSCIIHPYTKHFTSLTTSG